MSGRALALGMFCSLCVALWGDPGALALGADEAPSYKFAAGEELTYLSRTIAPEGSEGSGDETEIRLCVLRELPGPEWLVLMTAIPSRGKPAAAFLTITAEGHVKPDAGFEELYPDASFVFLVAPRLPRQLEVDREWGFDGGALLDRYECVLKERDAGGNLLVAFEKTSRVHLDKLFGMSIAGGWEFDPRKGHVVRSEKVVFEQGGGARKASKTVTSLRELVLRGESWGASLLRETRIFSAAARAMVRDRAHIMSGRTNADAALLESRRRWADISPLLGSESPLLPLWRDQAREIEESKSYYADAALAVAKQLDKPAPAWVLKDSQGTELALEGLRGVVVLLYFWRTDVPWCVLLMPQVMGLADHYAGRPVAVLGMNADEDSTQARQIAEALHVPYPNVEAASLRPAYRPLAYPALYVLDQDGLVRHIHIGWSRDLGQEVASEVERLLKGGESTVQPR